MDIADSNINTQATLQPEPQENIQKKSSNKKWFVFAGILFVLILSSITGAYLLGKNSTSKESSIKASPTPTPNPTADWKTYTNSKYNFQFKYPPSGQVLNEQSKFVDGVCGNEIKEETQNQVYFAYSLSIDSFFSIGVLPWNGTINEYLRQENIDPTTTKPISIAGSDEAVIWAKKGYTILSKDSPTGPGAFSIIKKGNNLFFMLPVQNIGKGCSDIDEDKMLSTFKFTDDETANWKTYNSTCSFTIKLPQDWNAAAYIVSGTENSCGRITDPNFKTYPNSDKRDGFFIMLDRKKIGSKYMNTQINDIESYLLSQEKIMTPQATINNRDDKIIGKFSGTEYDTVGMGGERQFVFVNSGYVYTASWPLELTTTNRSTIDKIISSISFN